VTETYAGCRQRPEETFSPRQQFLREKYLIITSQVLILLTQLTAAGIMNIYVTIPLDHTLGESSSLRVAV
jgi:hypothetical protein